MKNFACSQYGNSEAWCYCADIILVRNYWYLHAICKCWPYQLCWLQITPLFHCNLIFVHLSLQPTFVKLQLFLCVDGVGMMCRQQVNTAVNVCCIVDKLSDATAALGRTVAPHIRRHSTRLLPASLTQQSSAGSSKFDDACDIAASGLQGFHSFVYTHTHSMSFVPYWTGSN